MQPQTLIHSHRLQRKIYSPSFLLGARLAILILFILSLIIPISRSAAQGGGTLVEKVIGSDTTWTKAGSPYQIDAVVTISRGTTLTIEPGVVIETANISWLSYAFYVGGNIKALGTADEPIRFTTTADGWSGVIISGDTDYYNTGSVLEYVILDGGGNGESGSGANLVVRSAEVTVRHCQFLNSPGDGILGDNSDPGGVAHVFDSTFTNNGGYAIQFENGGVNPVLSNLTAAGNGVKLKQDGNRVKLFNDTIHGAQTWENMGLPYFIVMMRVGADGVLTIEPGVKVMAAPGNDALDVAGRIIVNGTVEKPVRFEPDDPVAGWGGMKLVGTEVQPSTGSLIDHAIITMGGYGDTCTLYLEHAAATVTNSTIDASADSGACLDTGADLTMSDTVLTNNHDYAIALLNPDTQMHLAGLTASGNQYNSIGVNGGSITDAHHWTKSGINTIDVYGDLTVLPTGSLAIDPGVTVRFDYGRSLQINGALRSEGTLQEPVLFTGAEAVPGHWAGIVFQGTPAQNATGVFRHTTLEYAGYGGGSMIDVFDGQVTLDHSTLRNTARDGIRFNPQTAPALVRTLKTSPVPSQVIWCKLYNIGAYAINNLSDQSVSAAQNWWGEASGPTAADNPGGAGSALSGPVIYQPYLKDALFPIVYLPLTVRR